MLGFLPRGWGKSPNNMGQKSECKTDIQINLIHLNLPNVETPVPFLSLFRNVDSSMPKYSATFLLDISLAIFSCASASISAVTGLRSVFLS